MAKKFNPDDIIGRQFGELTVLECVGKDKDEWRYRCRCSCGKETVVCRHSLKKGHTKSCGHLMKHTHDPEDIVGRKFGRLTVMGYMGRYATMPSGRLNHMYRCRCDCGREKVIVRYSLLSGNTFTCGDCSRVGPEGDHFRYYCHNGGSFIFSPEDYDFVSSHRWCISKSGYVVARVDGEVQELARLLLRPTGGAVVDHINGDRLNNLRGNLRVASQAENMRNVKLSKRNTSGYKGVRYRKDTHRYQAYIVKDGHHYTAGCFDSSVDAANAYDDMARKLHGEFARLNFPLPGERGCREVV